MRSSYRFPPPGRHARLDWWSFVSRVLGFRPSACRPGRSAGTPIPAPAAAVPAPVHPGGQGRWRAGSGGTVDDLDVLLGDLAVHDAVRAELERPVVVSALGGGHQDVVG